MTLVSDIISFAYREANTVSVGATISTAEQTEGLTLLQGVVDSTFPSVMGTKMFQWTVPYPLMTSSVAGNYPAAPGLTMQSATPRNPNLPPPNARMLMKNTTDQTLYFPYAPEDGALMEYVDLGHTANVTFDANGFLFGSDLTVTSGTTTIVPHDPAAPRNSSIRWMFRADLGAWVAISALSLTAQMPFPTLFDDYFVTALALRLAPRYAPTVPELTLARHKQMREMLSLMYLQSKEVVTGLTNIPGAQSFYTSIGFPGSDKGYY